MRILIYHKITDVLLDVILIYHLLIGKIKMYLAAITNKILTNYTIIFKYSYSRAQALLNLKII